MIRKIFLLAMLLTGVGSLADAQLITSPGTFGTTPSPGEPTELLTSMQLSAKQISLGEVLQGDSAVFSIEFTNTGTEDLIIESAKGSCGCTQPSWPTESIKPGAKGVIGVVYRTAGKTPGVQTGVVTIIYNGIPNIEQVTFDCTVKENPNPVQIKPNPEVAPDFNQHNE